MLKITLMPKETLSELLHYVAENERFTSISENLSGGIMVEEARAAFRELARELSREALEERGDSDPTKNAHLSRKTREIISYLSSNEEKTLLKAFGFIEK